MPTDSCVLHVATTDALTPCNRVGFDLHSVRRSGAPQMKPWSTGNCKLAQAALATAAERTSAEAAVASDIYAKSSVGPRRQKSEVKDAEAIGELIMSSFRDVAAFMF